MQLIIGVLLLMVCIVVYNLCTTVHQRKNVNDSIGVAIDAVRKIVQTICKIIAWVGAQATTIDQAIDKPNNNHQRQNGKVSDFTKRR